MTDYLATVLRQARPALRPAPAQGAGRGRVQARLDVAPVDAALPPMPGLPQPPNTSGLPVIPGMGRGTGFVAAVPIGPVDRGIIDHAAQTITEKERHRVVTATIEAENAMTPLKIDATRLVAMSLAEIEQLAVCRVTVDSTSGQNSVMDERMGVLADNKICLTCGETNMDCPGHYGMIVLNRWYLNPAFAIAGVTALQCVCNSCSRLKVDQPVLERNGILNIRDMFQRLQAIAELATRIRCSHHTTQAVVVNGQNLQVRQQCPPDPTYFPGKMKDMYTVCFEYSDRGSQKVQMERTIPEIDTIFRRIPDADLRLMGFSEGSTPRNWILKALPVCPPAARPYVIQDGELKHDYLTTSYCDIVRYNNKLATLAGPIPPGCPPTEKGNENETRKVIRDLHFLISHFMDNSDGRYSRCPDEPIQSIKERLAKKDGFIRGFSMGKRVNMCGRSVAGANNALPFGYSAYPKRFGQVLTKEIVVTKANYQRMIDLYRAGKVTYLIPGSGTLKGCRIRIDNRTRARYTPAIGDSVDRWSETGDETITNRAPTLHKHGFMGHYAWYPDEDEEDTDTLRILSPDTTPYNADFDGDEMNLHQLQTHDARAEGRTFAHVNSCIMSAQSNRPVMGMVYNPLSSAYMLCDSKVMFDDGDWTDAIHRLVDRDCSVSLKTLDERLARHGVARRSGRALFSALLPPDFYYNGGEGVKIRNGVLLDPGPAPADASPSWGRITKKHIGPAGGSIIQVLHKQYPKSRLVQFFTEAQWVLDWFLERWGLSIGYESCIAPNADAVRQVITKELVSAHLQIEALGPITPDMSEIEKDFHERQIQSILNSTTRIGRTIGTKLLAKDNPLNVMANSGAKGNESNTAQIVGLLGQQYIKGQRPATNITYGKRALVYFEPGSTNIEARGFVPENFMKGSKPSGLWFHMMASRIGLIDTAVNTAQTGAQHHRLAKSLEDVCVHYDGSVRNVGKVIFQFVAGGDGFNAANLQAVTSPLAGDHVSFADIKSFCSKLNSLRGYEA